MSYLKCVCDVHSSLLTAATPPAPAPPGGSNLFAGQQPAPYQRGPPQDYMEAITNKRLLEEVMTRLSSLFETEWKHLILLTLGKLCELCSCFHILLLLVQMQILHHDQK